MLEDHNYYWSQDSYADSGRFPESPEGLAISSDFSSCIWLNNNVLHTKVLERVQKDIPGEFHSVLHSCLPNIQRQNGRDMDQSLNQGSK